MCESFSSSPPPNLEALQSVVDRKAAPVPHIAITDASASKNPSHSPHFRSRATFADIGPITARMKAENEPRIAIIELNSGTRIETVIARQTSITRSKMSKMRLNAQLNRRGVGFAANLGPLPLSSSCGGMKPVSMPRRVSIVRLSYTIRVNKSRRIQVSVYTPVWR